MRDIAVGNGVFAWFIWHNLRQLELVWVVLPTEMTTSTYTIIMTNDYGSPPMIIYESTSRGFQLATLAACFAANAQPKCDIGNVCAVRR